jgi:peptidoglycan/xylan/chitin deacetylase (PgdA/CDA1 family)
LAETSISSNRWVAKKAARLGVGVFGTLTQPLTAGGEATARVITYHRFGDGQRTPFTVTAESFDAEMAHLAATGRAVSLADIEAFLAGQRELPRGAVLVTIDDGDPSVYSIALPILQKHGVPAVLYALAGAPRGFEVLTNAQMRELHAGGVTIGSHTISHRSLARLSPEELLIEVRDSKAKLEDVIGAPVTSIAYPFGTLGDFSRAVAECCEEAGYTTGFTSLHGPLKRLRGAPLERFLLPRIKVESGDPAWLFPRLCSGAMDGWRMVDMGLQGLQKPALV